MATQVKIISVPCSDWMLGWGLGGHNHLGKLTKDGDIFTWKGKKQGRHNNTIRSTYTVQFTYNEADGVKKVADTGTLPAWSELKEAIRILNSQNN